MSNALTSVESAQSKNAGNIKTLGNEYDGMMSIVKPISRYDLICMQDLEGQHGPARFFFACSTSGAGS
jgi:hypothetical protein